MRPALPVLLLLLAACAQMGSPPGGPVDDVPPQVVLLFPAADSTGVPFPHTIRIEFSEKMNKRTVEKTLRLFPTPEWTRTEWKETTLLVDTDRTSGAAPDDGRPVTVTVSARAEDRRGNKLGTPVVFTYTSGAELGEGRVGGAVENIQKGREAPPVTIRVVRAAVEEGSMEVLIESETAENGAFTLLHLPVDSSRTLLALAFQDDDDDGIVDYDFEFYGFSDTLLLTSDAPVADSVRITLVDAATPATLSGMVTPIDSTDTLVVALRAETDTVPPEFGAPDSTGSYSLTGIPAGSYTILLLRGTESRGVSEGLESLLPALLERPVRLRPGEKRTGFDLAVPGREPQVTQ
ncbi:MAG: Ig-like domain-containing protein [Candidatus Eisenbacteria bacterium]